MEFSGFEWDSGNTAKCQKHGLLRADIEAIFGRAAIILPDKSHSLTEKRYRAIGTTSSGRKVFIVFTLRERLSRQFLRPISARYMHKQEAAHYEKSYPDV